MIATLITELRTDYLDNYQRWLIDVLTFCLHHSIIVPVKDQQYVLFSMIFDSES